MKILDKKGRIFGKINLLDFLVILFLFLVLVFAANKYLLDGWQRPTPKPMKVVVFVDDIHPEIAKKLIETKEVYVGRGLVKTKVFNVEVLPMPEGSRRPDFSEVRIVLSGKGYLYSSGAYFENQRVAVGKKLYLRSIYELETTIMEIK